MGSACMSPRDGSETGTYSTDYIKHLAKRIDVAIESLPPYVESIINVSDFPTRAAAIEHAMKLKGYRKITPKEYAVALTRSTESVFIWKRINGTSRQDFPTVASVDLFETDTLIAMMQATTETNEIRRSTPACDHCISHIPTEEQAADIPLNRYNSLYPYTEECNYMRNNNNNVLFTYHDDHEEKDQGIGHQENDMISKRQNFEGLGLEENPGPLPNVYGDFPAVLEKLSNSSDENMITTLHNTLHWDTEAESDGHIRGKDNIAGDKRRHQVSVFGKSPIPK